MKNLFTSENIYALIRQTGLALGHSLWIGAVAALLAAITIVCTRRSKPELRYNLLTGLLLLFIAATGVAFMQSGVATPGVVTPGVTTPGTLPEAVANEAIRSFQSPSYPKSLVSLAIGFFAQNIYAITLAWLVIVLVKMTGLALGLYRLYQLKKQQLYSIGGYWEQRVAEFAGAMGVTQSVKIFQSGLVKVPTVLGHFKPVILVPLGVITSIPADQIEMVLLHELAHIRRLDFFVNFLQRLTELLFFFNPGILWISKLIREEREHCCDDMALRHSGNKTAYIRALLSFREYQLTENVYQLAFSGKGGVLQRAKRIASRTNPALGTAEKTVLLVAMFAFFTFSVLFAGSDGRRSDGRTTEELQQVKPAQSQRPRNANASSAAKKKQPSLPSAGNKPNQTENQIINKQNTTNKRAFENDTRHTNAVDLTPPDTLQPLQKPISPLYETIASIYLDSAGAVRLVPVQRQPYVARYQMQPLQTYQHEYRPSPIRAKRMAINEKILDAIERQGIAISRGNIDFRITNKELIVNGIKQPEAVHKSVLDAVLTKPDDVIDFTYGSHQ